MTISSRDGGPIRVVLVGYGLAGSVFHAPLIGSTPSMVLTGIVTSDPERRAMATARFPEARLLGRADEIFPAAREFDLVVIASPNKTHFSLAKQALEAGLHVVIDKPMATTAAECETLIRVSQDKKCLLTVFQNRRWDNDFLTAKQLIETGQLGAVTRFESRFERWRPKLREGHWRESGGPEEAGGLLYDLGSHLLDQAVSLFGKPKSLYAELDVRREGARVEDDVFLALTFDHGIHAHLWASAIACSGGPRFHIYGTAGTYTKFGLDPQEDALRAGRSAIDAGFGTEPEDQWGTLTTDQNGDRNSTRVPTLPGQYTAFYNEMANAIRYGAPVPVDPTGPAEVIRLIELARKTAERTSINV